MQEALRFLSPGAEPVDRADFVEQARLLRRSSEAPARGVAPGQAVVVYDGTRVVGSATIDRTRR